MQKSETACSCYFSVKWETTLVVCGFTETTAMVAVQQRMERFNVNTNVVIYIYLCSKIWLSLLENKRNVEAMF